jgi:hypothetical protein
MVSSTLSSAPPRRDISQHVKLFDARSVSHYGKANLNMLQALLDKFTDPGDLVLDPMAGTGSIFAGALTGRRVVTGDVEPQWRGCCATMRRLSPARAFSLSPRLAWAANGMQHGCLWPRIVLAAPGRDCSQSAGYGAGGATGV